MAQQSIQEHQTTAEQETLKVHKGVSMEESNRSIVKSTQYIRLDYFCLEE